MELLLCNAVSAIYKHFDSHCIFTTALRTLPCSKKARNVGQPSKRAATVHFFSNQSQISLSSLYHFIGDICKENVFETVSVPLSFRLAGTR